MSYVKTSTTDTGNSGHSINRRLAAAEAEPDLVLRAAQPQDLERINRVIARAIDSWRIKDRVKRISLPLYQYQGDDLNFLQIFVVENQNGDLLGVAATEDGESGETRTDLPVLNLHGIYVDPACHRRGVGSRLLEKVEQIASVQGYATLMVKAKADATGFFARRNFEKLAIQNPDRDYPYRYRKPLGSLVSRQGAASC